jgi:hypothetical protein
MLALSVGFDGQVLVADSGCQVGLKWITGGCVAGSPATPTATGIVFGKGAVCADNGNVGYGYRALFSMADGYCGLNTAVGYAAFQCLQSSQGNTALGFGVGSSYTGFCVLSPDYGNGLNTMIGHRAGIGMLAGTLNTFIGACAGYVARNSCGLVVIGNNTMCNTFFGGTSCLNTVIGLESQIYAAGCFNTVVGACALRQTNGAGGNTSLGYCAAPNIRFADDNTFIGNQAAPGLTTGSHNIIIGACAANDNNFVCLTGSVTGRLVIGDSNITCAQVRVAWTVPSDIRDKNVKTALPVGLDLVKQIEPIVFEYKNRETGEVTDDKPRYGFSAQNVLEAEKSLGDNVIVNDENPERLNLTSDFLVPVLVNAIKELSAKVEELERKLENY